MRKLISKDPVQRYKLGKKIIKAQNGTSSEPWAGYYTVGNWPRTKQKNVQKIIPNATPVNSTDWWSGNFVIPKYITIDGGELPEGNQKQKETPQTTNNVVKTPKQKRALSPKRVVQKTTVIETPQQTNTGWNNQPWTYQSGILNPETGQFIANNPDTQSRILAEELKEIPLTPGNFNVDPSNITRRTIKRNLKNNNVSNAEEYWNWLQNNRDSQDYKLFQNVMRTQDGNLNKEAFDEIIRRYGINGNFNRSNRTKLFKALNDMNLIGVNGSDAQQAFVDSYNTNFDLARKFPVLNQKLTNPLNDYKVYFKNGGRIK